MSPQSATAMQLAKVAASLKDSAPIDVLDRMQQTHDSIARRAFQIFDNNGRCAGNDLDDWFHAESELLRPVHLEVAESDDSLTIRAEVPGFSTKELGINIDPRRLTIVGKREVPEESKKGTTIYSERCANEILRVVDLPTEVDSAKVSTTLKDGILNIELPKVKVTPA